VTWRDYQKAAAAFFADLGMSTEVDARLEGARGVHDMDVVVRFSAYGIEHLWIVECKHWNRRVPKERVLTLQQLASDVGAHRAFLLCERGFQSGAVTSARLSNVTLTNLEDLRANAQADVQLARWDDLYSRAARIGEKIHSLAVVAKRDEHGSMSVIKPDVGNDFFARVGELAIMQGSLERARLGQFPVAVGRDPASDKPYLAHEMDAFLVQADDVLEQLDRWAEEQVAKPWPGRPTPAPGISKPGSPTLALTDDDVAKLTDRSEQRRRS
jgi:hypothetical protein